MTSGELKRALKNDCRNNIREKMEGVGSNFQVKHDPFCEGNHITETSRRPKAESDIILARLNKFQCMTNRRIQYHRPKQCRP